MIFAGAILPVGRLKPAFFPGVEIGGVTLGYLLLLTAYGSRVMNLSLESREERARGLKLRGRVIDGELECLFSHLAF
jgi:hypothetical protein